MTHALPASIERQRRPIERIIKARHGPDQVIPDNAADLIVEALPEILEKARVSSSFPQVAARPRPTARAQKEWETELRRAQRDAVKALRLLVRYAQLAQLRPGREALEAAFRDIEIWFDWLQESLTSAAQRPSRKGAGGPKAEPHRLIESEHFSAWWHRQRPIGCDDSIPPGWPRRERGVFGQILAVLQKVQKVRHADFTAIRDAGARSRWIDEAWLNLPHDGEGTGRRSQIQSQITVPVRPSIRVAIARHVVSSTPERSKALSFREAAEKSLRKYKTST